MVLPMKSPMINLGFCKVYVWHVPKQLTEKHKCHHFEVRQQLLNQYCDHGYAFLRCITTGNKTWIQHFQLESKHQKFEMETSHITCQDDGQDTSNTRKSNAYTFLGCKGDNSGILCREGLNSKECSLLSHAARHTEASNSQKMPKIMVGSCSVVALPTLCSHTVQYKNLF